MSDGWGMNRWLDAVVRRVQYKLVIEWDEWPEYLAVRGLSFEETIVHWGLEHSRSDVKRRHSLERLSINETKHDWSNQALSRIKRSENSYRSCNIRLYERSKKGELTIGLRIAPNTSPAPTPRPASSKARYLSTSPPAEP
jgi:hypothetical protein